MAKVFAITTNTENLIADVIGETAKASVIFTVSNISGKPLRGLASLHPLERTEESWLSIDGESEKDFAASGTQQFTVIFNKPLQPVPEKQTEPEEKYPYRLNIASAIRPDEDYDEGPLVTIYKPERKGESKGGGIPWWVFVIIGVVALAIIGIVLIILFSGGKAKKAVPDVTTTAMTFTDAKKAVEDAGFTVPDAKQVLAPDKKVNTVIDQDPDANVEAEVGSAVTLSVPEKATVPTLKDKCIVEAMIELNNVGLKIKDDIVGNMAQIQSCVSKIQSTNPAARASVAKGSFVSLSFTCNPKVTSCVQVNPKDFLNAKNGSITESARRAGEKVFSVER